MDLAGFRAVRLIRALTLLLVMLPVAAGIAGTLAPAFGYLPAAGSTALSLEPFRTLMTWPGLSAATYLSVSTGVLATVISLALCTLILASLSETSLFRLIIKALSPALALPHATVAFGLLFLLQPSGWLARLFSPWLTGWARPPDVLTVHDPAGIALILGLIAKETPFLLLIAIAALGQINAPHKSAIGASLGYGRVAGWIWTVFPSVYGQMRLPVYAVLAYSLSVVDVALILGPTTPNTLTVQITRWMNDPDLSKRMIAAAGALLQLSLVLGTFLAWYCAERLIGAMARRLQYGGHRLQGDTLVRGIGTASVLALAGTIALCLAGAALWSVAAYWRFPDALPNTLTSRTWLQHGDNILNSIKMTMWIALPATFAALCLTVGCLEADNQHPSERRTLQRWVLFAPLVFPQITFLPGIQIMLLHYGIDRTIWAVMLVHLLFIIPYVRLSLEGAYQDWDNRHRLIARGLGASEINVMFKLRLPMLLAPILTAASIGIAVSVGQYLPTLLIGAGRVSTVTTEAVALASGGDLRVIGAYALSLAAVALMPFGIALIVPRIIWRNRQGLRHD